MYLVEVNGIGLIVSLVIVKWDSSGIYGELGVKNSVVKARELGILLYSTAPNYLVEFQKLAPSV